MLRRPPESTLFPSTTLFRSSATRAIRTVTPRCTRLGQPPNTSTGRAGPPPRHSIRWSSTISKRFSPKPPRTTAWATVSLYGWRRTCERIYDAASSPTASLAYGVRTAATSGSSRSHANPGASVHHVIRAAWPRSPPTSRITCCLTFPRPPMGAEPSEAAAGRWIGYS